MDCINDSNSIAKAYHISQLRVQKLYKQYKDTGEILILQKCGKKERELTKAEEKIILEAYDEY